MNITRLLTDALIMILRHLGRSKVNYPAKLRTAQRAKLIEKIKQQNKGDK